MTENQVELKAMTLGDILDYTFEAYKSNFRQITLMTLILYVPFVFVHTLFTTYLSGDLMDYLGLYGEQNLEAILSGDFVYMIIAYYVSLLAAAFIGFIYGLTIKPVLDAGIIKVIYRNSVYREKLSTKAVLKESFKKFPALFVNRLLYSFTKVGLTIGLVLIFYVVVLVFMLVIGLNAGPGGTLEPSVPLLVVMGIVSFAAVLVGALFAAYIMVKMGFGTHAIAIENRGAIEGFSRSSFLTKKNFWHIFMSYLFGYVLFLLIPAILSTGANLVIYADKQLYVALSTAMQVVSAVIYPFLITLTTMIYINLKVKKEGLDLELKVDKILLKQEEVF